MVEHDLAKVGVAGSSPVFRSESSRRSEGIFFEILILRVLNKKVQVVLLELQTLNLNFKLICPGGGIGRHAGLKIL